MKQKEVKKAFSGNDILIQKYFGFTLRGWVPRFFVRRVGAFMSSGVIEWWKHFVSVDLVKIRTRSGPRISSQKYKQFYKSKIKVVDDRKSRRIYQIF